MDELESWNIGWNIGGLNTIEFIVHNNNSGSNYNTNPNPTGFTAEINAAYLDWRETHNHVPEPTTMLLFATSLLGLAGMSRRKKN